MGSGRKDPQLLASFGGSWKSTHIHAFSGGDMVKDELNISPKRLRRNYFPMNINFGSCRCPILAYLPVIGEICSTNPIHNNGKVHAYFSRWQRHRP